MKTILKSPEVEAFGDTIPNVQKSADMAVRECGSLDAAIAWCKTWCHRRYFSDVLQELKRRKRKEARK